MNFIADEEKLTSRFFHINDEKTDFFIYDLPKSWWSRKYEYEWARKFVDPNDVVLDAASGVFHPLRFHLAEHCQNVYACDFDKDVEISIFSDLSTRQIKKSGFPIKTLKMLLSPKYMSKINSTCCSITNLPYGDEIFDTIFCISVLEHLNDVNNSPKKYQRFLSLFTSIKSHELEEAMREFHRVLKTGGKVLLTFDYPIINLDYFEEIAFKIGFDFMGGIDKTVPLDALYSRQYNLHCFRAVLSKK